VGGGGGRERGDALRLFVALELPRPVRAALASWTADAVGPAVVDARPLPEDSLHVTLCFLGARRPGEVGPIAESVRAAVAASATSPVVLGVGETVWLPRRRSRVCAVALRELTGGLGGLQAAVAARLTAGGWYAPEERPFYPHVSVARLRVPLRRRGPALAAPELEPFSVPGVALLRSWPGSRYESLARVALPG
jgi:2'-5' RNA ligase